MKCKIPYLVLGTFLLTTTASAEQVVLTPTVEAVIPDPGDGDGDIVLIRFTIPDEVTDGRVVRATLWHGLQIPDGQGGSIWVHPAPAGWDPSAVDRSWWLTEKPQLEERQLAHFDTPRNSEVAHFEVSRWVREWVAGERMNTGLLLRRPPGDPRSLALTSSEEFPTPVLRVTYRSQRKK